MSRTRAHDQRLSTIDWIGFVCALMFGGFSIAAAQELEAQGDSPTDALSSDVDGLPQGCSDEIQAPAWLMDSGEGDVLAETWVSLSPDDAERAVLDKGEVLHLSRAQGMLQSEGAPPSEILTRRAVIERALSMLGQPCGVEGGASCGTFVHDVLTPFGLRPSSPLDPGRIGSFTIDLRGISNPEERLRVIEAAHERGPTFLLSEEAGFFFLGRDREANPKVVGALKQVFFPCPSPEEGSQRAAVNMVVVLPLHLQVSPLIQTITHVAFLSSHVGHPLEGVAEMRSVSAPETPKRCKDSSKAAIFFSPLRPDRNQPLRIIATFHEDPGPGALVLVDGKGERHIPEVRRLGGPPYSFVATVESPTVGRWKAFFGEGRNVEACATVRVRSRYRGSRAVDPLFVWQPARRWTAATENFFSAFVESLFDYPVEEDLTWPNLQEVLNDRDRNLLYNYRGLDEEARMHLEPDCADLPYLLRMYFAWKMRLPFAVRKCGYGWSGRPPKCEEVLITPQFEHGKTRALKALRAFMWEVVRTARSASARTHPKDVESDFYPVALSRESLRPGTTYVDPYGHLLVIAKWVPQALGEYGKLIAADAQPDGTVGRRRFWRGSFLFTPSTETGGSGFKAHRPVKYSRKDDVYTSYSNYALRRTKRFARYSREQYDGSSDLFYERVEALINPRPLDPVALQLALVDSLEEAISRRLNSVENGERFMAENDYVPMEMPSGTRIFQTSGPWEDFSTPSRDLRLLIAIDTVVEFPNRILRSPERFGAHDAASGEALEAETRSALRRELRERSFTYRRSDGTSYRLTLQNLVDRAVRMEMAYNPNDCAEIRWGGELGSEEMETCKRHAPEEQRSQMESYRSWFSTRQRPTRRM